MQRMFVGTIGQNLIRDLRNLFCFSFSIDFYLSVYHVVSQSVKLNLWYFINFIDVVDESHEIQLRKMFSGEIASSSSFFLQ